MNKHKRVSPATYQKRLALLHRIAETESEECVLWPHSRILESPTNRVFAEVVVCELRHGPRRWPTQPVVHLCGDPLCFNYRHMRWSDTQKKPAPRDLTVDEIRSLRRDGLLVVDIAQKFGVSIDVVQQKMDASRMRYL